MQYKIDNDILELLRANLKREYTIPEIMSELNINNREKVATSVGRLEGKGLIEMTREKGKSKITKYYRFVVKD